MRSFAALTAALLLPAFPALAQDKSVPAPLSKEQLAKIQQINGLFDARVKAAFAGDEKTVAAMKTDLKAIDAEKDPARKTAAITAYQTKHAKTYKAALAKGKVDLAAWAAALQAATGYQYFVKDGTHVLALPNGGTDAEPAPPAPTTKTLRSEDFEFIKSAGCGAISGSDVTRSSLDMTNDNWAAEAGGCRNSGEFTHALDLAPDQTATVEIEGDLNSEAWAVGAVAAAFSSGSTAMAIRGTDHRFGEGKGFFCSAGAPFLWAAWVSCGGEDVRLSQHLTTAGGYKITVTTYTSSLAGGVVAATASKSTIRNLSAKITLEPR